MYPSIGKTSPIPGKCYTDIPYGKIKPDMPDINYACQFPFTYQGKIFHKCTKMDWDNLWCALEMTHPASHEGHAFEIHSDKTNHTWGNCMAGKSCGFGEH